jgi:arginine/serine-rich splicing factor 1/9
MSSRGGGGGGQPGGCTIFVGNLPYDIRERELDDLFYKFGRIAHIKIPRCNHPPAFAFIEFEDKRDAEDAQYYRDGYEFDGNRLRVEISKGSSYGGGGGGGREDRGRGGGGGGGGGGRFGADERGRGGGGGGRGSFDRPRRTDFCVIVRNLPPRASWQDLKDFFRRSGKVTYANAFVDSNTGEQIGEVDFEYLTDAENACDDCDGIEFENRFGVSKIQCDLKNYRKERGGMKGGYDDQDGRGGGKRYSNDEDDYRYDDKINDKKNNRESSGKKRGRSRSRSYSRSRSRSPSPGEKKSRSDKYQRGRSRSRSRSPPRGGRDEDDGDAKNDYKKKSSRGTYSRSPSPRDNRGAYRSSPREVD